jgi:proline iminopeptidase
VLTGCQSQEEPIPQVNQKSLTNGEFDIELDGFNIHYAVFGKGSVCIALTNSWGLTWQGVRSVMKPLEEYLTMVYFDPRGIGKSDPVAEKSDMSMAAVREVADALREHLGLEKAIFIGWSNGASNLMMFAAEYPETVSAAIMMHGAAYVSREDVRDIMQRYPELYQSFAQFQQEMMAGEMPIEKKDARLKEFFLETYMPTSFANSEKGRELLPKLFENAEFSWDHFLYSRTENMEFDARESLKKITAPCLVIAGQHDKLPIALVQQTAYEIPDARFEFFNNSGHFSSLEETEDFVNTVLEFLQQHIE